MNSNDDYIAAVRAFNRFYTKQIDALSEGHLKSNLSLAEMRILFELFHSEEITAKKICTDLNLDTGYVSRILRAFEERGWIKKIINVTDARQMLIALTAKGKKEFAIVNAMANDAIQQLLLPLTEEQQRNLVNSMKTIQTAFSPSQVTVNEPYLLRNHRPGDMGWVVYRHGVLYSQEYGWDERFEGLVADVVAKFVANFNPQLERCWIAEREGRNIGSIFLVRETDQIAKLRLLIVEPEARGLGVGKRLVEECIRFAKQVGYKKISLWTNSNLLAARSIYEKIGFQLVAQEKHNKFGEELIGETWELLL